MSWGKGQTHRLATIPRGFNSLNWNTQNYCQLLNAPYIFRNQYSDKAVTSFGVYAPYTLFDNSSWSLIINGAKNTGDTVYYDRGFIDLTQYNVVPKFIKEIVQGEWTITNTQAIDDLYCFDVTVDETENSVNIKIKQQYDGSNNSYNEFCSHLYIADNSTAGVCYFCLFFEEKTPTTKYTITQNLTNVNSDYSGSQVTENEQIIVNLSVNEGYNFVGIPSYTMGENSYNFTATSTGYTAAITVTDNVTITAAAAIQQFTITQNLTNVNSDYSGSSVNYGVNITVNLTAETGYNFSGIPSYTMGENSYNFTATSTGYTAAITVTDNVTITAAAVLPTQYRLNQTLTFCTCNYEAGLYNGGSVLNLVLTPTRENYGFKEIPVIISGGVSTPFIVANDKLTATLEFILNNHATIRATAAEGVTVQTNLTYCEITTPSSFPLIFNGDSFSFNIAPISSLYEFQETPFIQLFYFEGITRLDGVEQADGSYNFEVQTNSEYDLESILITGRAGIKQVSSKYGLVNMYSPTLDELEDLARSRFQGSNSVDMGQFIISLRKMYCTIPTIGKDVIDLGYYYSEIETDVINTDTVVINCGSVLVNEIYENGFDYSPNTKTELFLPLVGFMTIETEKVMNKQVELLYYFNIMTNDITIILRIENGSIIETWTGKGGFDIPFIYNAYSASVRNNVDDVPIIYAGFTPFFRLTTNIPYYPLSDDTNAKDTKVYKKIGDCEGYTEIDEVDFNATGQISSVEIQEIKNLLRSGVVLP